VVTALFREIQMAKEEIKQWSVKMSGLRPAGGPPVSAAAQTTPPTQGAADPYQSAPQPASAGAARAPAERSSSSTTARPAREGISMPQSAYAFPRRPSTAVIRAEPLSVSQRQPSSSAAQRAPSHPQPSRAQVQQSALSSHPSAPASRPASTAAPPAHRAAQHPASHPQAATVAISKPSAPVSVPVAAAQSVRVQVQPVSQVSVPVSNQPLGAEGTEPQCAEGTVYQQAVHPNPSHAMHQTPAVAFATGVSPQPAMQPSAHPAGGPPPAMQSAVPAATAATPADPANPPASRLRPELRLVRSRPVPTNAAPMLLMRAGASVPAPVRGTAIREVQATTLPLGAPQLQILPPHLLDALGGRHPGRFSGNAEDWPQWRRR
jgi:hypothetical protein